MNTRIIIISCCLHMLSVACDKPAGEGGQATITGKVFVREYDKTFSVKKAEYYAQAEDVYIIYGNEVSVGNRTRTNYDGTYQFKYMRKGTYKVYAYSKDSTFKSPSGDTEVIQTVNITKPTEEYSVPEIVILK